MTSLADRISYVFDRLFEFQLAGTIIRQEEVTYDPLTQRYSGELVRLPVTMVFASSLQRGVDLAVTEPSFQRVYVRSSEMIRTNDYILTDTRERWNILSVRRYPSAGVAILDVTLAQYEDVDPLSRRLISSGDILIEDEDIDISDERELGGITLG